MIVQDDYEIKLKKKSIKCYEKYHKDSLFNLKYEKIIKLNDGSHIGLRFLTRNDFNKLFAFFELLSKETIFYRHFSQNPNIKFIEAKRILSALNRKELIIIAEDLNDEEIPFLGIIELIKSQEELGSGELAVIVADKWQGKHLGQQMIEYMILLAKMNGFKKIFGYYLINNYKIHSLIQKLGHKCEKSRDLNIIEINFNLDN